MGGIGLPGDTSIVTSHPMEGPMHKTIFGLAAVALMAVMVASAMESTPTGAHASKPAASAYELMAQATDLPVAPAYDAF